MSEESIASSEPRHSSARGQLRGPGVNAEGKRRSMTGIRPEVEMGSTSMLRLVGEAPDGSTMQQPGVGRVGAEATAPPSWARQWSWVMKAWTTLVIEGQRHPPIFGAPH